MSACSIQSINNQQSITKKKELTNNKKKHERNVVCVASYSSQSEARGGATEGQVRIGEYHNTAHAAGQMVDSRLVVYTLHGSRHLLDLHDPS